MGKDSVSKILAVMGNALVIFEYSAGGWSVKEELQGKDPQVVALHPARPNRVYVGTFGKGLWVSDDLGESWTKNKNFDSTATEGITSIGVSPESI